MSYDIKTQDPLLIRLSAYEAQNFANNYTLRHLNIKNIKEFTK